MSTTEAVDLALLGVTVGRGYLETDDGEEEPMNEVILYVGHDQYTRKSVDLEADEARAVAKELLKVADEVERDLKEAGLA